MESSEEWKSLKAVDLLQRWTESRSGSAYPEFSMLSSYQPVSSYTSGTFQCDWRLVVIQNLNIHSDSFSRWVTAIYWQVTKLFCLRQEAWRAQHSSSSFAWWPKKWCSRRMRGLIFWSLALWLALWSHQFLFYFDLIVEKLFSMTLGAWELLFEIAVFSGSYER